MPVVSCKQGCGETEGDAASAQRPQSCKPLMPLADLAKMPK